jgi:hypothetical protein
MSHEQTAKLVAEAFKEAGFLTGVVIPRDIHGHTMDRNYTKLWVQKGSPTMKHVDVYETKVAIINHGFYMCEFDLHEPDSLNKIIDIATEELRRMASIKDHVQNFTI